MDISRDGKLSHLFLWYSLLKPNLLQKRTQHCIWLRGETSGEEKVCLWYSVGSYLVGRETEGGEHFGSFEHSDVHSLLFLAPWRRSQSRNWNSENFWDHIMFSVGGIRFRLGLIYLYEFEQTPGDDGQGSWVCCSPWGCEELDMT